MFGGEDGLIVDGLLHVGHEEVDVLRRWEASLLALLIDPKILPENAILKRRIEAINI
jgi:hypothetical protein